VQGEEGAGTSAQALDGGGNGVRDIVELEVEEDLEAQGGKVIDDTGAVTGEELEAEFYPAEVASEGPGKGEGLLSGLDVEGEDQLASFGHGFSKWFAAGFASQMGARACA
jgi:hypothetical protein